MPYPTKNLPHKTIRVRTERYSGPTHGFSVRVSKYADAIRTGRRVFDPGEHVSFVQRMAAAYARTRVAIQGSSLVPVANPDFSEFTYSGGEGESPYPKYSVCMTCYNEASTVRDSLNSLLGQLNENFEVIVVDNFSADGTYEILREFERSHKVKVIQKRCTRGLGRQLAFENSSGEYVIANLDLDDVFLPVLAEVISLYHERVGRKLLAIFNPVPTPGMTPGWVQNITIGPRALIASLGGWRDLNIFEDWDIWSRASRSSEYRWTSFRFAANVTLHPEQRRPIGRMSQRYERYRDRLQLGKKIFSPGEKVGLTQRLAHAAARFSLVFKQPLAGQDPEFDSFDPRFFIDLAGSKIGD